MPKSFGITKVKPLTKARAAARESAELTLGPLNEQVRAGDDEMVTGDFLVVPIDELYLDPKNPRWAGEAPPTWDEIQHPETASDAERRVEIEKIHDLARSMAPPIGQQTPIDAYRGPHGYHVISGEGRYWGLRLAGIREAKIILRPEPPVRVRLSQHIENAQRRSLNLRATLHGLEEIMEEAARIGEPIDSAVGLASQVGYSERMGFRWWAILKGPEDVREAIRARSIKRVIVAEQIAKVGNAKKRQVLLRNPAKLEQLAAADDFESEGEGAVAQRATAATSSTLKKRARGRVRVSVDLGKTQRLDVAKTIITRLDADTDHSKVDWNSFDDVTQAWRSLLKRLETNLS